MGSGPPTPTEEITTLGRYQLAELLGRGGQAIVWRATDSLLGVERAIKLLSPAFSAQPLSQDRLLDEARILARVAHTRVLNLFDIGREGDHSYIVMELARYGTLARVGPLTVEDTIRYGVQVLAALDAAHAAGVIHRDVKPSNVLRFGHGLVKLADFGVALHARTPWRSTGMLGTPAYCAPEQRSDPDAVDLRADLYSTGALLYELMVAESPRGLFTEEPDSCRWDPLQASVRPIVQRALSPWPTRRFSSARSMAEALLADGPLPERERSALWALFRSRDETVPPVDSRPRDAQPSTLAVALPELRGAYIASLVERASAIEAALERLDLTGPPEALAEVRHHAHQLHGSAGAYGFPALSSLAREVEEAPPERVRSPARLLVATLRGVGAGRRPERTVLVAADDDALWNELASTLPAGSRARRTSTAAGALAEVERHAPDLLLVDLQLGDDDARNLTQQVRGVPAAAAVPIVVFAPDISPEVRSELYALGADEVAAREAPLADRRILVERLLTGPQPGRDRRVLRAVLHEARKQFVLTSTPYCVALVAWDPKTVRVAEPERQVGSALAQVAVDVAVAHWDVDALALAIPGVPATSGELLLNVALQRLRAHLPGLVVAAGMVSPADGAISDTLVQAEHLARVALRAGTAQVVVTTLEARSSPRIAVCDDDPMVLQNVVAVLEASGLSGIPFDTGEALLKAVVAIEVSAVVLDLNLKGRDGFWTLEQLRATPGLERLPVVMLTAAGGDLQVARAFELGADDWVSKPFSPVQLAARVHRLLRRVR